MRRISALWRSPSPRHPAAAWAWCASAIVLVSAGHEHGLHAGLRGAVVVFITWAIVRELAPARAMPSLLAPFASVAFAIPSRTDVLACLGVLIAARVALRSTGAAPTLLDRGLLCVMAWLLSLSTAGLPVALVLAAVVFADDRRVVSRITGCVLLAIVLVTGALEGTLVLHPGLDEHALLAQVLLGAVLVAAGVLLAWPLPRVLAACDDQFARPLDGRRLRSARIVVVASLVAALAWVGTDGVFVLSAGSAAILAVVIGGAGASGTLSKVSEPPRGKGSA